LPAFKGAVRREFAVQRFKVVVFTADPRDGAQPRAEFAAIAESQGHATKLVIDHLLGKLPWRQIDVMDSYDALDHASPCLAMVV
jgi:hypothetical protein